MSEVWGLFKDQELLDTFVDRDLAVHSVVITHGGPAVMDKDVKLVPTVHRLGDHAWIVVYKGHHYVVTRLRPKTRADHV